MGDERCKYTTTVTGYPNRGRLCCWRPVFENADRCVWHADPEDKSLRPLESSAPAPGERLDGANFRGLSLHGASWLAGGVFIGADFSNTDLREADLSGADLRKCSFEDSTASSATFEGANLEDTNITDADLRDADLTDVRLDQSTIASSRINEGTAFGDRVVYESKLRDADNAAENRDLLESSIRMYRTLEDLSQENTFYKQASHYYRQSKDLRRRYNWTANNYAQAVVAEFSRWTTGYGNMPTRVISTSFGVILLWGLLYPLVGTLRQTNTGAVYTFTPSELASVGQAGTVLLKSLFFSVVTFTTLGYGNVFPVGTTAEYLASLEALLGSILMALLVGVLTRSTWLR